MEQARSSPEEPFAGLVIGTQTARIRKQAANAVEREARTEALYLLSRRWSGETRVFEAAQAAATLESLSQETCCI